MCQWLSVESPTSAQDRWRIKLVTVKQLYSNVFQVQVNANTPPDLARQNGFDPRIRHEKRWLWGVLVQLLSQVLVQDAAHHHVLLQVYGEEEGVQLGMDNPIRRAVTEACLQIVLQLQKQVALLFQDICRVLLEHETIKFNLWLAFDFRWWLLFAAEDVLEITIPRVFAFIVTVVAIQSFCVGFFAVGFFEANSRIKVCVTELNLYEI